MEIILVLAVIVGVLTLFTYLKDLLAEATTPNIPQAKPLPKVWKKAKGVTAIDYNIYINSIEWLANPARQAALLRDDQSCTMCGDHKLIQVHHVTYERLGKERPSDLVTLCAICHNYTHYIAGKGAKLYPPIKSPLRS